MGARKEIEAVVPAAAAHNASRLAHALAELPGIDLDPATVQTNIVIFGLKPGLCGGSATAFLDRLKEAGVRAWRWVGTGRVSSPTAT